MDNVARLIGKLANLRGRQNEDLFFLAFEEFEIDAPSWFVGAERAPRHLDHKGIDAIVKTTDVGDIYLQIKSSLMGKKKFEAQVGKYKQRHIAVIIIHKNHTNERIRQNTYELAGALRRRFLEMRFGKNG